MIVGLLNYGVQLNINGYLFFSGRSLKGSVFGGMGEARRWVFGDGIIDKRIINAGEGT